MLRQRGLRGAGRLSGISKIIVIVIVAVIIVIAIAIVIVIVIVIRPRGNMVGVNMALR